MGQLIKTSGWKLTKILRTIRKQCFNAICNALNGKLYFYITVLYNKIPNNKTSYMSSAIVHGIVIFVIFKEIPMYERYK